MGFFKKKEPKNEAPSDMPSFSEEPELYSELPNLPEAPSDLPEIELPLFDQPEEPKAGPPASPEWHKPVPEPVPEPPKQEEPPKNWLSIPSEVPELKPFQPEVQEHLPSGSLVSQNNAFFLSVEDFRMTRDNLDKMLRMHKKHHVLTDVKKEENIQYERINTLVEDVQRKLMHMDRILFD